MSFATMYFTRSLISSDTSPMTGILFMCLNLPSIMSLTPFSTSFSQSIPSSAAAMSVEERSSASTVLAMPLAISFLLFGMMPCTFSPKRLTGLCGRKSNFMAIQLVSHPMNAPAKGGMRYLYSIMRIRSPPPPPPPPPPRGGGRGGKRASKGGSEVFPGDFFFEVLFVKHVPFAASLGDVSRKGAYLIPRDGVGVVFYPEIPGDYALYLGKDLFVVNEVNEVVLPHAVGDEVRDVGYPVFRESQSTMPLSLASLVFIMVNIFL